MRSICSSVVRLGLPLIVRKRSYVYLMSSALSSRPFTGGLLCQRTPRLSLNTYAVSFGCVHDSARSPSTGNVPGCTPGPALCFSKRLCVNERLIIVHQLTVRCGSNPLGSVKAQIRKTPPRLGVWASALPGSIRRPPAPTAPAVAAMLPSLRRSRRLTADISDSSMFVPLRSCDQLTQKVCPRALTALWEQPARILAKAAPTVVAARHDGCIREEPD